MKNNHRLGWPPALLAMDPDPRTSQRTPSKPPVSAADEQARRRELTALLMKKGNYVTR